jgi:hypothetical protein
LVESAKIGGVPASDIFVVVGESPDDTSIIFNGEYNIVFCKYATVDYNAAVYLTQTPEGLSRISAYTHFFYMHDTCEILPGFWSRMQETLPICTSYIKLQHAYSKTIGLLNTAWFLENKTRLMSYYVNTDQSLIVQYKSGELPNKDEIRATFPGHLSENLNEDSLFMFDSDGPIGMFFSNSPIQQYTSNVYDGIRMVSEYPNPGLRKFQKNWGQGDGWKIIL